MPHRTEACACIECTIAHTRWPAPQTVKDKKLKGKLKREEDHIKDAVQKAAMWETLLPESRGYGMACRGRANGMQRRGV
jgi:hypothetical protein